MTEKLLQFIWQYSLYHPVGLKTIQGQDVTVIQAGRLNKDSGPDFTHAKIKLGDTLLAGHVELHLKTSDWYAHQHQKDNSYRTVILHVVLHHDKQQEDDVIPVLELAPHIQPHIEAQYTYLLHTQDVIPCAHHLYKIPLITKESMLQRTLAERWEMKWEEWQQQLIKSNNDWRQLLYERLAINFGFKTNAHAFYTLATSLPLNILARHKNNLLQLEALLFGQAGLLPQHSEEDYVLQLKNEYQFLSKKYQLQPIQAHQWKFLRMRPANFPTIRIAQFAQLIHRSVDLLAQIIHEQKPDKIIALFDIGVSDYWKKHFVFGKKSGKPTEKHLGATSIDNIIINTVAPIQFYYHFHFDQKANDRSALNLLENLPAENNSYTKPFATANWHAENAAQSQAQIQLFQHYCASKRCLECAIGLKIIKNQGQIN